MGQGLCDVYVLLTNAGVSGRHAEIIEAQLKSAGARHVLILGAPWIEQQIRENKRLRMLVPRVYGLGDLSQILDERAYSQAKAILESLREDLAKVVITDSYRKAAAALDQHGFALLVGEPAVGKTTIASMLAMGAADQWGASVLKLDEPATVVDHWNPDEPSQFFWIDDAFGVTQYEGALALGWNHVIPQIRTMLRKGAKIVMTSRDYIYNRARQDLKESAFPLLNESKVVIDVHDLTIGERRQILYNHLKLGSQPQEFRVAIKPYLESIAANARFIPEIARRLAAPFFTKGIAISPSSIDEFVDKRERILIEVLEGLDRHSRASLALIYMRNGRLESPIVLEQSEEEALERLGGNIGECIAALEALRGSLVLYSHSEAEAIWKFKHPTIGDAFAVILVRNPELLSIFVRGSSPDKLLEQVTCGDVGAENAVVLPKPLFSLMLERLSEDLASRKYKSKWLSPWAARQSLYTFLARRCTREFLEMYLAAHPTLVEQVSKPGLYLDSVSEVDVAARLHAFGLLPEDGRRRFVETVSEYAAQGEDVSALDDKDIQSLFRSQELLELHESVRSELIPRLGEVRHQVEFDFGQQDDPDEHMSHFLELLSTLKARFADDEGVLKSIEIEFERASDWISERSSEEQRERRPRSLGQVELSETVRSTRSIFDDVDA